MHLQRLLPATFARNAIYCPKSTPSLMLHFLRMWTHWWGWKKERQQSLPKVKSTILTSIVHYMNYYKLWCHHGIHLNRYANVCQVDLASGTRLAARECTWTTLHRRFVNAITWHTLLCCWLVKAEKRCFADVSLHYPCLFNLVCPWCMPAFPLLRQAWKGAAITFDSVDPLCFSDCGVCMYTMCVRRLFVYVCVFEDNDNSIKWL